MLAAAIGIHRAIEADIRRLVAADHGLGGFLADGSGKSQRGGFLVPAIVLGLAAGRGKAIVRIAGGATPPWRALGLGHVETSELYFCTV